MDYTELLRRLAIDDGALAEDLDDAMPEDLEVDAKTLALARIGALVAIGAAEPSFSSQIDAAVSAGATAKEIVHVLVGSRVWSACPAGRRGRAARSRWRWATTCTTRTPAGSPELRPD